MRFPKECSVGVALKVLPLFLLLCSVFIISLYLGSRAYVENIYREKVCRSGECPDDPSTTHPVCGSDGRTYGSECSLVLAGCSPSGRTGTVLRRAHYGECTEEELAISGITGGKPAYNSDTQPLKCPPSCRSNGRAVCGTDGRTYRSVCHLRRAACGGSSPGNLIAGRRQAPGGRFLAVAYFGRCRDDGSTDEETTSTASQESDEDPNNERSDWLTDEEQTTTQSSPVTSESKTTHQFTSHTATTVFTTAPSPTPATSDQSTYAHESPVSELSPTATTNSVEATETATTPLQPAEAGSGDFSDQSTVALETPTPELSPTATEIGAGATERSTSQPAEATETPSGEFDWPCPAADGQCHSIPFRPICGSDGMTYPNLCALRDFACKTGDRSLTPVRSGNCTEKPETEECFSCDDFFDPVCGTDKQSYLNVCQLKREACLHRNSQLKVSFEGLCEIPVRVCSVSRPCNPFSGPSVCGTDGVTYPSLCYLRRTACKRRDFSLVEAYSGDCMAGRLTNVCLEQCPDIDSAVCGTDGLTYRNYCVLQRAVCRKPGLFHAYDGQCNRVNQFPQGISVLIP